MKLYRASGHVVFLLTFAFEGCARSGSSPSASAQYISASLAAMPKRFCNSRETSELFRLGSIILYFCDCTAHTPATPSTVNVRVQTSVPRVGRPDTPGRRKYIAVTGHRLTIDQKRLCPQHSRRLGNQWKPACPIVAVATLADGVKPQR
jgi:hypothetical protein